MKAIFARNLRQLCSSRPSIAVVCRDLGISQQQFNSYVTGKHLPNQRIVDQLCAYFRIAPSYLYTDHSQDDINGQEKQFIDYARAMRAGDRPVLASGLYDSFFTLPDDAGSLLKGSIFVETRDGYTTFRRISFVSATRGGRRVFLGDNRGLVYGAGEYVYLAGLDRRNRHQPSLLALRWLLARSPILVGHGLVATAVDVAHVRVALQHRPRLSKKDALGSDGIVPLTDPLVPDSVRRALSEPRRA